MSWYRYIGIDTDLLKKVDPKHSERQTFILSTLTIMLFVISFICFFSSIVYALIIFQNWLIAIFIAVFLSVVVFNLYRLLVMTALDVSESSLEPYYLKHEKHYSDYVKLDDDYSKFSDVKINEIVYTAKDKLREKTASNSVITAIKRHPLTMSLRILILIIIALVFSNGLELFLFNNQINEVLNDLLKLYTAKNETWLVENMLSPANGSSFSVLNTNSLLLALDILIKGLGYWKLVIDFIFILIFLLPLIIVIKSKEIKQSEYVRELALSELTITFYHYLHTQKLCKKIETDIKSSEIVFSKTHELNR
ncbi:hypothetical protein [Daejeonella sp.]|jgi:hypothetical protein|uniref:hypothetical protein n=1 Tax=Daejeonella sp. TaxID=2805397 RepID=UPI0037C0531B